MRRATHSVGPTRPGAGQDERLHAGGLVQGERQRHVAAHGQAEEIRGLVDLRQRVFGQLGDRGPCRPVVQQTGAEVVVGDHGALAVEQRHDVPPHPAALAEAGDQQERGAQFRRSTSIAIPWPPPTHIVSSPIVPSSVSRSFSSVHMIRAPVMP